MYKPAIEKLRELAKENDHLCENIKSGKVKLDDIPDEKVDNLIKTYRYWYQCCLIAAWLLENES